jgi:hypothetical protein
MTGIMIELYKIHPEAYTKRDGNDQTNVYRIDRFQAKTFESLSIDLNTPISPMPLPEDKSTENILVKMEGNSQVVRFGCKFDSDLVTLSHVDGISLDEIAYKEGNFNVIKEKDGTIYNYLDQTEANNILLANAFITNFESRSITDSFLLRVVNTDNGTVFYEGYGSIQSITSSIDSASPVVWTVNVDYMVGNVISIYDADTPEGVTGLEISSPVSGTIRYRWNDPVRAGGSTITEFSLAYQEVGNAEINYFIMSQAAATSSITNGKYQKEITGLTGQYYVYLVANNTSGSGIRSERIRVDST